MDLNQLNAMIDRGYVLSVLLAIAFLLVFFVFKEQAQKK